MLDSRAVRILTRYFVARYLALFAVILVASTSTIVIVEILLNSDEMFGSHEGVGGMLAYVLLRIPSYYLRDLVPIAAFAAAFFTLGLASRWLEITAMKAGGISPHRATLPLIAVAGLLALSTLAVNETLVIHATRSRMEQRQAEDEELVFRRGAFWYHRGRTIYNIQGADPQTHTLRGVEVFQRTAGGRLELDIVADRVQVAADGTWHLENATVRRFDPDRPEEPTRLEVGVAMDLHVSDDRNLLLRQTDAASLPLRDLAEYIERHADDDQPVGRARLQRLRTLLHQRLSEPAMVLLFTLLAIPLGLHARVRGGLGPSSLYAVATVGCFFLARNVSTSLATEGILPGTVTVWSVLVVFGIWGCLGIWRTAR